MASSPEELDTYEQLKGRLDEIAALVSDDAIELEDALDLYEEAVKLGLRASDIIEQGTAEAVAAMAADQADDRDADQADGGEGAQA